MVMYDFITVHLDSLGNELRAMNRYQDKIIAVTQDENVYTIFYEVCGNKEDGDDK